MPGGQNTVKGLLMISLLLSLAMLFTYEQKLNSLQSFTDNVRTTSSDMDVLATTTTSARILAGSTQKSFQTHLKAKVFQSTLTPSDDLNITLVPNNKNTEKYNNVNSQNKVYKKDPSTRKNERRRIKVKEVF